MIDVTEFALHFALAIMKADSRRPQAINVRSKKAFSPGIGPHSESETVRLVKKELERMWPEIYRGRIELSVAYPELRRQKCDLCLGAAPEWDWAIEAKMLRMLGDNGKLNDNMLMHILSPYPAHRSALTDCGKLASSKLGKRKAILIYGYDHAEWPINLAIEGFEKLASSYVKLGERQSAQFSDLVHPVHSRGGVFIWQLSQV